jgi:signal peptidase I
LGETIVFSTQDLEGLPDNQHYIKRLCGRPGDQVELKPDSPWLWINGQRATKPERLAEIAEKLVAYPSAPAYLGYQAALSGGFYSTTYSQFDLGPGEYLALGDNTANSLDSRYWGKVPARNLLGPATFVHWPLLSPRWGKIR